MMSKKWCEENKATTPVDRRKGIENAASFRANGTGPFTVVERQPNVKTSFKVFPGYWGGKIEGNVTEVIYTAVGPGRCHGAGAGAGCGAHQCQRQCAGAGRP